MTIHTGFTAATFSFLADLAENNSRDWFRARKGRYERDLVEPAQRFILAIGERLQRLSPSLRADPRRVGGSMFRMHRDLRFAKDKTPYKTHAGIQFRHAAGKDAHAPGLYVHVEPDNCFVGIGVWRPASAPLRAIRTALTEAPERWRIAVASLGSGGLSLAGDSLIRMPRGFDAEHPLAADLKRKDFIAVAELARDRVVSPDFADDVVDTALAGQPFLHLLCDALGVSR
ncbi:MAG: TIGR02453 family protein [Longimicrobiales bacterium]